MIERFIEGSINHEQITFLEDCYDLCQNGNLTRENAEYAVVTAFQAPKTSLFHNFIAKFYYS